LYLIVLFRVNWVIGIGWGNREMGVIGILVKWKVFEDWKSQRRRKGNERF
jgi:hypothetical protein